MKTIGIFEAQTKLSEVCEEVARTGCATEICRRGKPLVRIVPLPDETSAKSEVWELVSDWESTHPATEEREEFERPPQISSDRDPLADYWEESQEGA